MEGVDFVVYKLDDSVWECVFDNVKDPFSLHAFSSMFPELLLSAVLLVLVSGFTFVWVTRNTVFVLLFCTGLSCIGWAFWVSNFGATSAFFGVYSLTTFSKDTRLILFLFFMMLLLLDHTVFHSGKVVLLMLGFSFLGMMLMLCFEDYFFLFLASELVSLSSCFLLAFF